MLLLTETIPAKFCQRFKLWRRSPSTWRSWGELARGTVSCTCEEQILLLLPLNLFSEFSIRCYICMVCMPKCRGVTLWSDAAWGLKYSAWDAWGLKEWRVDAFGSQLRSNQAVDQPITGCGIWRSWAEYFFYCCRSLAECGGGARIWHGRDEKLSVEQRNSLGVVLPPSLNLVMDAWCHRLTDDWFAVLAACSLPRQKKANTLGLLIM